jgi:hypothetical protein
MHSAEDQNEKDKQKKLCGSLLSGRLRMQGPEKRKPAFNHPDHAGLSTTSIVTSLKNKLNHGFISAFFLRRPIPSCHPDKSLCRATIMH